MYIHKVKVKNFRLLMDIELVLEEDTTLIVGRNNSGKTSLSEVMRRLLTDTSTTFQLEDFSSASYDCFCNALAAYQDKKDEVTVRDLLPVIELRLQLRYDPAQAEFGTLAPFIVDLDPNCNEALTVIRYELKDGALSDFFGEAPTYQAATENPQTFFKLIRERIPRYFAIKIWAEDPNDSTNRRVMKPADLRHLVKTGFINAQRGLDDVTSKETDVLAKILEGLFSTASSELADEQDKLLVDALTEAVQEIQTQIDQGFGEKLKGLLPALKTFGYPGLGGQELKTETTLDVRRLLTSFTKVRYAGYGGIALPEAYNGLGVRNLTRFQVQSAIPKDWVLHFELETACETNHSFCWSVISGFQKQLRELIAEMPDWQERITEAGGLRERTVEYTLGHRSIREQYVYLHHNDVLPLTIKLMENAKFRRLVAERYPIILIDEYQDTDADWVEAIKKHFFGQPNSPLFGFFGDHWQKIYGNGCGKLEHPAVHEIGKEANFRSCYSRCP